MGFNDDVKRLKEVCNVAIREAKKETWVASLGKHVDIDWQGEGDYAFFREYGTNSSAYGVYWYIRKIDSHDIGKRSHIGYFKEYDRVEMTGRIQNLIDYQTSKTPDNLGFLISIGRWKDEMKQAKKQSKKQSKKQEKVKERFCCGS